MMVRHLYDILANRTLVDKAVRDLLADGKIKVIVSPDEKEDGFLLIEDATRCFATIEERYPELNLLKTLWLTRKMVGREEVEALEQDESTTGAKRRKRSNRLVDRAVQSGLLRQKHNSNVRLLALHRYLKEHRRNYGRAFRLWELSSSLWSAVTSLSFHTRDALVSGTRRQRVKAGHTAREISRARSQDPQAAEAEEPGTLLLGLTHH